MSIAGAALLGAGPSYSQPAALAPFADRGANAIAPPWRYEGLPESLQRSPTLFTVVNEDGAQALRIAADDSYGTVAHPWQDGPAPGALAWRWQLAKPLANTDIKTKEGDDSALKVCVMFDQPLDQISLFERTALRLARVTSGKPLPAATVCYLWDSKYPAGSAGPNPYTERVRYIVLRGPDAPLSTWVSEKRDTSADFQQLFGGESPQTPPVTTVAIGADSDNTHGSSLGYLAALHWVQPGSK